MTGSRVSFGLALPQRGVLLGLTDIGGLTDLARRADANPLFDSVWVGDSLFSKPRPDSIALLGALAAVTKRVKLGVGCMATFPVRDPLVFAFQWATLDVVSAGRMILAACTGIVKQAGASEEEGRPWGVSDGQRAGRMAENIDICRALWTGKPTSYAGRWTSFSDVTLAPVPVQDPCPIWIASNPPPRRQRPEAIRAPLRRVARVADGWMTVQLVPNAFDLLWRELSDLLLQEGKDPDTFPTMTIHNININEDAATAFTETERLLNLHYGPVFDETAIRSWTAWGPPQACIEQLASLKDAGAKTITLRMTAMDQTRQFERLVEEVLPYV